MSEKEKVCQNIKKYPSLRLPIIKKMGVNDSKKLSKNKKIFMVKAVGDHSVLLSSNICHTNPLNFLKIQTVVQTYFLMPGASNFAILVFSMGSFYFWQNLVT